MYKVITCLIICGCLIFTACSSYSKDNVSPMPSVSDEAKFELKKPVNCNTAARDINVLEKEKASVGKQILAGVRSILPISVVAGLLMNDYNDRTKVAIGDYNKDIEEKIAEIRRACSVN